MSKIEPMSISKKVKAEAAQLLVLADRYVHAPPKANSPAFANLFNQFKILFLLSHDQDERTFRELTMAFKFKETLLIRDILSPSHIRFLRTLTDALCDILFATEANKTRFLAPRYEPLPPYNETEVKAQLAAFVDQYSKPRFAAADMANPNCVYKKGFYLPPSRNPGWGDLTLC